MSQAIAAQANRTTAELQCVRCGQSGHLSKDCPWPALARAHLALDVARCQPLSCRCKQAADCARATDWPETAEEALRMVFVDASIGLDRPGSWCPMFIDARGLGLRGAA